MSAQDPSNSGETTKMNKDKVVFSGTAVLFKWEAGEWLHTGKKRMEVRLLQSSRNGRYKLWVRDVKAAGKPLKIYYALSSDDAMSLNGRVTNFDCNEYDEASGTLRAERGKFVLRFPTDTMAQAFHTQFLAAVDSTAAGVTSGQAPAPLPAPAPSMPSVAEEDETVSADASPVRTGPATATQGTLKPAVPSPVTPPQAPGAHSRESAEALEAVFGTGYNTTGGASTTALSAGHLPPLSPSAHILDVGCGVGGSTFHLARTHGCSVTGIDACSADIALAGERRRGSEVAFEAVAPAAAHFPLASFHAIHAREATLGVPHLGSMLQRWAGWLKPGGTLVLAELCQGEGEGAEAFKAYAAGADIHPLTRGQLQGALEKAGFTVQAADHSGAYAGHLEADLVALEDQAGPLASTLTAAGVGVLRGDWEARLSHLQRGGSAWVVFTATLLPKTVDGGAAGGGGSWTGTLALVVTVGMMAGAAAAVYANRKDAQGRPRTLQGAAMAAVGNVQAAVLSRLGNGESG